MVWLNMFRYSEMLNILKDVNTKQDIFQTFRKPTYQQSNQNTEYRDEVNKTIV